MANSTERYAFLVDYYDVRAAMIRKYQLFYYPSDSMVEMFEVRKRRSFLKKSKCEGLRLNDLYIGAVVDIYSRQLTITEYGDEYTRMRLICQNEKTLAMIKPDAIQHLAQIIDIIYQNDIAICNMKMVKLSREEAEQFYEEHYGKSFFKELITFMVEGPMLAMELKGSNAVSRWRDLIGPTDPIAARKEHPSSLRAKFGTDNTRNACHGSCSDQAANREIDFFFGPGVKRQNSAGHSPNCTLGIIKPHAVAAGLAGKILISITDQGFKISALQMFCMERKNAEEFLEVYKGVLNDYSKMVDELCCGRCMAFQIDGDAPMVQAFRDFVGPSDPEIACQTRSGCLRAQFGEDKVKNAVHCTDLPDDGCLECEYFFNILDSS